VSFTYYLAWIAYLIVFVEVVKAVVGSIEKVLFPGEYVRKELQHPKPKEAAPWNYWRPMKVVSYKVIGDKVIGKVICPDGNVHTVEATLPRGRDPRTFLEKGQWCYCVADQNGYLHCEAVKHTQPPKGV